MPTDNAQCAAPLLNALAPSARRLSAVSIALQATQESLLCLCCPDSAFRRRCRRPGAYRSRATCRTCFARRAGRLLRFGNVSHRVASAGSRCDTAVVGRAGRDVRWARACARRSAVLGVGAPSRCAVTRPGDAEPSAPRGHGLLTAQAVRRGAGALPAAERAHVTHDARQSHAVSRSKLPAAPAVRDERVAHGDALFASRAPAGGCWTRLLSPAACASGGAHSIPPGLPPTQRARSRRRRQPAASTAPWISRRSCARATTGTCASSSSPATPRRWCVHASFTACGSNPLGPVGAPPVAPPR